MNQPIEPLSVYQLRIVLREISPLIWRRLLVCSDTTLAQLHTMLQITWVWLFLNDDTIYVRQGVTTISVSELG